jgi:hypothetical protein
MCARFESAVGLQSKQDGSIDLSGASSANCQKVPVKVHRKR